MQEKKYVIGLMSGTSLDGLDLVYVEFDNSDYKSFEILASDTVSYSKQWKYDLQNAISYDQEKIKELNIVYGKLLGDIVNTFIRQFSISKIDFIASHGHTVFHQPENGLTLQIGDGQTLANTTNQQVICDFRTQDVQLGGQGAPLVPIGDELLFFDYDYCVNLGGFANISYKKDNQRIAFDICPVNIVLNHYVKKIGFEYDDKGNLASKGKIDKKLLNRLNMLDFYQQSPPKSLGLEWVKTHIFPLIDECNLLINDILRTFIEHIAIQIGSIIKNSHSVLVTGGGVYNSFLMHRIEYYANASIDPSNKQIIEYKEALIFAFLGLLRSKNEINCLQSVTGSTRNHSSGKMFSPDKK